MPTILEEFQAGLKEIDRLMGTKGRLLRRSRPAGPRSIRQSDTEVPIPVELIRQSSEKAIRSRTENIRAGAGSPRLDTNANVTFELRETWRIRSGQKDSDGNDIVPDENDKLEVNGKVYEILSIQESGSTGAPVSFILEVAG